MGLVPSLCISDTAGPAVHAHVNPDPDRHVYTLVRTHREKRSLIQSLALMHSAIMHVGMGSGLMIMNILSRRKATFYATVQVHSFLVLTQLWPAL